MIACDMSEEVYHSIDLGGGSYLCEGVSRLKSKPGADVCMNMLQRVTFTFRKNGDKMETVHIHISVPYEPIKDDELFPIEFSRG